MNEPVDRTVSAPAAEAHAPARNAPGAPVNETAGHGTPLLEVRSLTRSFGGVRAVHDVGFTVRAGGARGHRAERSGQDDPARHGHRLHPARRGAGAAGRPGHHRRRAAHAAGAGADEDVPVGPPGAAAHRPRERDAGRAPLHPLGLPLRGLRLPRARREERALRARAATLLDFLGLTPFVNRPAADLPAGAQRLVEVARGLAGGPRVLLLDEPAAGLDDTETAELADVLVAVHTSGVALVLVEHNIELVMKVSERILVLDAGRVVADGTPAEVRSDPAVIEAYLGGTA